MNILQVCAPIVRPNQSTYGSSFSTVLLCRELQRQGHTVTMAVRSGADLAALAREAGVEVVELPFAGRRSPAALLTLWRLVSLAKKTRADVIATQLSRGSYFGAIAGKWAGVPVVSSMRALDGARDYAGATRVLAVSEAVKKHIEKQGVPGSKVDVVHNGIEVADWESADGSRIRTQLGVKDGQLVTGVVARLDPTKGHRTFLEAAAEVSAKLNAKFVLVGDGPEQEGLLQYARESGLDVVFAGYQKNIPEWVAAFDILVLPSRSSEGLPRTLLEAGACSKPVVATAVGGSTEVVADGKTGLLVPPDEPAAMAEAMLRLLENPQLRNDMGRAARENIRAHFTVDAMARNTVEVYRAAGAAG